MASVKVFSLCNSLHRSASICPSSECSYNGSTEENVEIFARSDENHVMDVQRYGRTRIMISNMQKL